MGVSKYLGRGQGGNRHQICWGICSHTLNFVGADSFGGGGGSSGEMETENVCWSVRNLVTWYLFSVGKWYQMGGATWGDPHDGGIGQMFFGGRGYLITWFFCFLWEGGRGGGGTAWGDPNSGGLGQMFFVGGEIWSHDICFLWGVSASEGAWVYGIHAKKHNSLSLQQFGKTIVEIDDDASA